MTDDLFKVEETLSPRLAWMKENGIRTNHAPHLAENQWAAWRGDGSGYGDTEDEAIVELAKKLNLKLWNE